MQATVVAAASSSSDVLADGKFGASLLGASCLPQSGACLLQIKAAGNEPEEHRDWTWPMAVAASHQGSALGTSCQHPTCCLTKMRIRWLLRCCKEARWAASEIAFDALSTPRAPDTHAEPRSTAVPSMLCSEQSTQAQMYHFQMQAPAHRRMTPAGGFPKEDRTRQFASRSLFFGLERRCPHDVGSPTAHENPSFSCSCSCICSFALRRCWISSLESFWGAVRKSVWRVSFSAQGTCSWEISQERVGGAQTTTAPVLKAPGCFRAVEEELFSSFACPLSTPKACATRRLPLTRQATSPTNSSTTLSTPPLAKDETPTPLTNPSPSAALHSSTSSLPQGGKPSLAAGVSMRPGRQSITPIYNVQKLTTSPLAAISPSPAVRQSHAFFVGDKEALCSRASG